MSDHDDNLVAVRTAVGTAMVDRGNGRPARRGMFIVFEGVNCSGKSTAIPAARVALCRTFLAMEPDRGPMVVQMKDPDSAPYTWVRRALMLMRESRPLGWASDVSPLDEATLYALNRYYLSRQIEGLLREGTSVICDRWIPSTLIYQPADSFEEHVNIDRITQVFTPLRPDLTIVLDVDYATYLERRAARRHPEFHHALSEEQFEKIRQSYQRYGWESAKLENPGSHGYYGLIATSGRTPRQVASAVEEIFCDTVPAWYTQRTPR